MSAPAIFQVLPPLTPDEYRALEESIRAHGIAVPIIVDENGAVIDGHHRQEIAARLGMHCPQETKKGLADAEKRTLALSINLDRRHLTREQRRALVVESIKADPQLSDREHGRRTGVSDKTATTVRDELEARAEIPHVSERTDSLGRQQPSSKPPRPQPEPDTDALAEELIAEQAYHNHDAWQPQPDPKVADILDNDRGIQDAKYLHAWSRSLVHSGDFLTFDPERIGQLGDDRDIVSLEHLIKSTTAFLAAIRRSRTGLKVVN